MLVEYVYTPSNGSISEHIHIAQIHPPMACNLKKTNLVRWRTQGINTVFYCAYA